MTDIGALTKNRSIPSIRSALAPMLCAIVALMALVWLIAWLFALDETSVLGVSLALVALGLLAIAIRQTAVERAPVVGTRAYAGVPALAQSTATDPSATALGAKRWSLEVFAAIDAQRFAAVCETWFSWAGFDTRTQSHRTDGGVDIWLHAARMPGPVAIVRCKHWLHKPVGLQDMKEFLGVVANFQSAHGTYTTTSTYTPEALQFARDNGIDAVDGRGLLRRIQTRTRQRQQDLLAIAYSGQN